jgi:DNA-binding SARP family transcriptional activator/tetratricopeptide (TPR) repeat protein
LRATLFETFRLLDPDGQPIDPGSPTTRSLIAYLLLNRGRPADRRRLAFTFWPGTGESAARRNLRQYLHHIRAALAPIDPDGTLLTTEGSSIQFNPQAEIDLDVERFLHETRPDASVKEIEHALSLYTGDLLEDIYDDWCVAERERLRQVWLGALDRYSQILQAEGKVSDALTVVQTWTNAEPFDESAQRRLMSLYALSGERAKAIQTYHSFARSLVTELDTEPLPETQALLHSIQSGGAPAEAEPLAVVPAPSRTRSPRTESFSILPFIGRKSEIETLESAYGAAARGTGGIVLVTGEAGIGKTRLLQEYMASRPDFSGLQSACYELDSMVPFAPLRQALETSPLLGGLSEAHFPLSWAATIIPNFPGLARYFPQVNFPSHQVDGATVREALVNLIVYLSECSPAPMQLILDDLHWADTPTWELLASLTRRVTSAHLLIIGLLRLEDLPVERRTLLRTIQRSDSLLTLDLPRLSPLETADLARQLSPREAGDSIFFQRLYQETEGNPFFIVETVRAIQETGGIKPPLPVTSIPNSIQRVIEARLDRLGTDSREALACAAAIGRSFTYPLLQEILGNPSEKLISFIEEWLQRGLVLEGTQGYDFRHDKFRQVAYAGLSRARREYIHGRIADVLEHTIPPADVTMLAYHYARSNQPLKALPYLTQAGEQALRLRSYHEARQFGLQAVNLLGQLPGPRQRSERIDINLQLAQAYAYTGDMQRAIEILNETEHLAVMLGDAARLGQIFRRAAQFFWLRGTPETASDYARRTLRVAEELEDLELLYASLRMLGRVSIALAAFDDAIAHLLRYVNIIDELYASDPLARLPEDLPIVLGYLGVAYSRVGAWERAIAVSQRGLSLAEAGAGSSLDATTIFARMQLAMVQAGLHKWEECLEILSPIPETRDFEEITPPLYMLLSLRGFAQAQIGEPARGIQTIQAAVNWAEQVGHRVFHYLPRQFLAESLFLAGKMDPALKEVKLALREAQIAGNRWATGTALKLQADINTRLPSPHWTQIETDLIESMHLLRQIRARPDLARTYLSLRRLYDRAGQIAWAVDCHFRATTIFDELKMENELRFAQGQAARERQGAVVIPNLPLRGPNVTIEESVGEE